jgi:SAM-dependent methyltransferase
MTVDKNYDLGCRLPADDWLWLNGRAIFDDPRLRPYVAPFPSKELMTNVSGLTNDRDFAAHGVEIFRALAQASPKPIADYRSILDFGCGCGRLARMFKGHPNRIVGCDIDKRHVNWVAGNLGYMTACLTSVNPPLPFGDNEFDAIFSISIFSHLTEKSQDDFLAELSRITSLDGYLFLTIHGARALERAKCEEMIRDMLWMEQQLFEKACAEFEQNRHAFILQQGHLTTVGSAGVDNLLKRTVKTVIEEPYQYGITFIPETYIFTHWAKWFHVVEIRRGAIHDFQDIVVLRPRK